MGTVSVGFVQEADFFWSTAELNQGAQNGPLRITAGQGDVLSLYLYYSSNGVSDQDLDGGALLDLATSRPEIVRFSAAESFNSPILIQDIEIGNRWFEPGKPGQVFGAAGNIGCVSDELVNEWGAFGIISEGMIDANTGTPFLDGGYDANADAFLFGRIEIEVVGNGLCTLINAGRGRGGIVIGEGLDAEYFAPVFGSCLISVDDFLLGDVNVDGDVNLLDVEPFIDRLVNDSYQAEADANCDDSLDLRDVVYFIRLLEGRNLPVEDPTLEDDTPKNGQLGDSTGDGFVDLLDAECYALIGTDCGWGVPGADINMDGVLDLFDLFLYVEVMLNQK